MIYHTGIFTIPKTFIKNIEKISRVLPITFVLYCEHTEALNQLYTSVSTYGPFFAYTIVILNLEKPPSVLKNFPAELDSRITVLTMPDRIAAGSAIKKFIPYLKEEKVFLIDARVLLKKEVITTLRYCEDQLVSLENSVVSFQTQNRAPFLHKKDRIAQSWHDHFDFVSTTSWGGLFFYAPFILEIGSFHSQLREESLMIDLSFKIQNSTGVLVQTQSSLVTLEPEYQMHPEEQQVLAQLYPDLYPSWTRFFSKFFSKFFVSHSSQNLVPPIEDKKTH